MGRASFFCAINDLHGADIAAFAVQATRSALPPESSRQATQEVPGPATARVRDT